MEDHSLDRGAPLTFMLCDAQRDSLAQTDREDLKDFKRRNGGALIPRALDDSAGGRGGDLRELGRQPGRQDASGPSRVRRLLQIVFGKQIHFATLTDGFNSDAVTARRLADAIMGNADSINPYVRCPGTTLQTPPSTKTEV